MQTIRESRYPICTDAILEKGNPLGLEEAAHADPVRDQKTTHIPL